MRKGRSFNVEVFFNGKFRSWFPCFTIKELYETIARYEQVSKLSELKCSYLIFREGNMGSWELYSKGQRYYLACCLNTTGKEKPEFFKLAC